MKIFQKRFFDIFLRDKICKSTRADQKLIEEGSITAHGGDPLTEAKIFFKKKRIRTDGRTFGLLYAMTPARMVYKSKTHSKNEKLAMIMATDNKPIPTLRNGPRPGKMR